MAWGPGRRWWTESVVPPLALLVTSVGQKDMMSQKTEPVCEAESCRRALGPLGGLSPAGDTVQLCVGSSSTAVFLVNPRNPGTL